MAAGASWDDVSAPEAPAAAPEIQQHVDAIIQHESGGDPSAVGDLGRARGLGQMHPEVRRAYGVAPNSTAEQQRDAVTAYFSDLWRKHAGNADDALSEYHLGATNLAKDRNSPANIDYLAKHRALLPGSAAPTEAPSGPPASEWDDISVPEAPAPAATPKAAAAPVPTSPTTPEARAPTFMGEMAKEGERQIEAAKSIGADIAAPFTQPSSGVATADFAEGVKHGVHAAWSALGLVHPGVLPEAALTAAGHPIAGKVAGVATDVALPFALGGKGTAIKTAEEAAQAAKGAIGTATREAVTASKAGYEARDVAADVAKLTLPPTDPAIAALKKVADETVKKHGSKAAEWVGRIEDLGKTGDVTHEEVRNIEAGLTEMAKRDPWIGHLRDAVSKTRSAVEAQAPDIAAQSAQLAKDYPAVAALRRLKGRVVNPSAAPSTERTTAEALRALNDPDRMRQAIATMDEKTAKAFQLFHRQAKLATALGGGASRTMRATTGTVLTIEGGRLLYNAAHGRYDLGEIGGAGAALLLHNPRVAMMAARALTTPALAPAAGMLGRSLDTALGLSEGEKR